MTFTPEMRAKAAATRAANKAKAAAEPKPLAPAKSDDEFAGLNKVNCCTACDVTRCAISWQPYCAHPLKGGLQATQMHDQKAIARANRAKEILA